MDPSAVVNHAIDALVPYLPAVAATVEDTATHILYETVATALRKRNEHDALQDFVHQPRNNSLVKRILNEAVQQDPALGVDLARATASVSSGSSVNTVTQVGNEVHGDLAGRDVVRTNSTTNSMSRKTTNSGGIVLAVVVIVALILGFIAIKALAGSVSGLSGSSTCNDFLASSDVQDQDAVMKRLYLAAGKPQLAGDPFLLQNSEYYCSHEPNVTLSQLAQQISQ